MVSEDVMEGVFGAIVQYYVWEMKCEVGIACIVEGVL